MTRLLGNELLRGDLVYLNRITRDDLPHMLRMWSDIYYLRYLSTRMAYPETAEGLEGFYKWLGEEETPPSFAIRLQADDRFLGVIAFKDLRWQARHSYFWIGIGDADARGKGYGTDAIKILLRYAFLEMNLNCIALQVFAYNTHAISVYEKLGFVHEGRTRAILYRDGEYYDMLAMSMLRSEWEARYR